MLVDFLRRLRTTGSIERKTGSGRHGCAVLCVFKFSQVVYRHICGNVANFVIPRWRISSCFYWCTKCWNPSRNAGAMDQN